MNYQSFEDLLNNVPLQYVLRPINEAIAARGMTPEECEAFFEQELSALRAERSLGVH